MYVFGRLRFASFDQSAASLYARLGDHRDRAHANTATHIFLSHAISHTTYAHYMRCTRFACHALHFHAHRASRHAATTTCARIAAQPAARVCAWFTSLHAGTTFARRFACAHRAHARTRIIIKRRTPLWFLAARTLWQHLHRMATRYSARRRTSLVARLARFCTRTLSRRQHHQIVNSCARGSRSGTRRVS